MMTARQYAAARRFERGLTRIVVAIAGMMIVAMLLPIARAWLAR